MSLVEKYCLKASIKFELYFFEEKCRVRIAKELMVFIFYSELRTRNSIYYFHQI